MNLLYLAALLVSIAGMIVLDVRFKLFFAASPWRAAIVLVVGVAFFLAWDVAGITLGIFFRGNPDLLTGVLLAPELPLEELFFLVLLCYTTMNLYATASRWSSSARRARVETGSADR
ncbi:lycopene cyclase domain-containing protein [Pseudolysinimonas yzui]|nr:lycopene cyclase domain-containing protein [Pseudolysinimonas yzui]